MTRRADLRAYSGVRFFLRGKGCLHLYLIEPAVVDGDHYAAKFVCGTAQWQPVTVAFKDLRQAAGALNIR